MLNSGYGALANKHFLYYKVENAEAITMSGQLVNKWTSEYMNDFFKKIFESDENFWTYGDTDSVLFTIKPFVDSLNTTDVDEIIDQINKFSKEIIEPTIEARCQELSDYMNCYEQRMIFAREVISNRSVFVAKKKYVMSILDDEGIKHTKNPSYKIVGMESVKSSTPAWARDYLVQCYKTCIEKDETELQKFVTGIKKEFNSLDVNAIAMPRGVNDIGKWYDEDKMYIKGTPKHVKAAIAHNLMLKKLNLDHIEPITDGSKIKFVELNTPNPTGIGVIGFDTYLPKEFNIEKYINREVILEKSFTKPLSIFLDAIGWADEEQIDMFSL